MGAQLQLDVLQLPGAQQPQQHGGDDGGGVEVQVPCDGGDVEAPERGDDDVVHRNDGRDDEPQLCRDDDHDDAVLKLYLCR